jgi:hypothetical protein
MAYATHQHQVAAMRAYSKTPAGKAAKKRSHERYVQKRRDMGKRADLSIDAAPLAQAINQWRAS